MSQYEHALSGLPLADPAPPERFSDEESARRGLDIFLEFLRALASALAAQTVAPPKPPTFGSRLRRLVTGQALRDAFRRRVCGVLRKKVERMVETVRAEVSADLETSGCEPASSSDDEEAEPASRPPVDRIPGKEPSPTPAMSDPVGMTEAKSGPEGLLAIAAEHAASAIAALAEPLSGCLPDGDDTLYAALIPAAVHAAAVEAMSASDARCDDTNARWMHAGPDIAGRLASDPRGHDKAFDGAVPEEHSSVVRRRRLDHTAVGGSLIPRSARWRLLQNRISRARQNQRGRRAAGLTFRAETPVPSRRVRWQEARGPDRPLAVRFRKPGLPMADPRLICAVS